MSLLRERRAALSTATRAPATHRAYATEWRQFTAWCRAAGRLELPATAETVELYATDQVGRRKPAGVSRALAAVAYHHKQAGHASPVGPGAREVVSAAKRLHGAAQESKAALTVEQLRQIVGGLDSRTPQGARDRALLVVGLASGLRRSELSALNTGDVAVEPQGLRVAVRSGKTDQQRRGRLVGLGRGQRAATCPVRALEAWLAVRGTWAGPLFVTLSPSGQITGERLAGQGVGNIVKAAVERIGLDPALYGGHSLRAGCVTAAVQAGASELAIMQRTGHRSVAMLHRYVRPASIFAVDPLARVL